jgi:hypothetical protein
MVDLIPENLGQVKNSLGELGGLHNLAMVSLYQNPL